MGNRTVIKTYGTVFTILSRVLSIFRFLTFALAALACAMTGTFKVEELSIRGNAGVIRSSTFACGVTWKIY